MTDLEITKLCAEAMGFEFKELPNGRWLASGVYPSSYIPLHDNAQAMALVDRLSINIHHHGCADHKASLVTVSGFWKPDSQKIKVCSTDLKRAICECVAKMQLAKQVA